MAAIPTTSTTLLRDIAHDPSHVRWNEFVARYRPMMEAFMRERFPSVEADDIIQETLMALCKVLPDYRYEPDEKGRFHNYLTGILRNKALRALRKDARQNEIAGMAAASVQDGNERASVPDCDGEDPESYREAVFEIALRRFLADELVADRTKRIFERATSSIPARRYQDVASLMGAIRARHRAFRLLAAFFAVAVAAIVAVAVWQYGKAAKRDALEEKLRLEESIQKEHEEILEMLQRDVY